MSPRSQDKIKSTLTDKFPNSAALARSIHALYKAKKSANVVTYTRTREYALLTENLDSAREETLFSVCRSFQDLLGNVEGFLGEHDVARLGTLANLRPSTPAQEALVTQYVRSQLCAVLGPLSHRLAALFRAGGQCRAVLDVVATASAVDHAEAPSRTGSSARAVDDIYDIFLIHPQHLSAARRHGFDPISVDTPLQSDHGASELWMQVEATMNGELNANIDKATFAPNPSESLIHIRGKWAADESGERKKRILIVRRRKALIPGTNFQADNQLRSSLPHAVTDLVVAVRPRDKSAELTEEEKNLDKQGYRQVQFVCPRSDSSGRSHERAEPALADVYDWTQSSCGARGASSNPNNVKFTRDNNDLVFLYVKRDPNGAPLTDIMLLPFETPFYLKKTVIGASRKLAPVELEAHTFSRAGSTGSLGALKSFVQRRVAAPPTCEILDTLTAREYSSPTWSSTFVSAVASAAGDWLTPVTDAVNAGVPVPGALGDRAASMDGAASAALQPALLKVAEAAGDESGQLVLHSFALGCAESARAGFVWTRVMTSPYLLDKGETNLFRYAIQPFLWLRRRRIAPPLPDDSAVAASAAVRERCLASSPAFTALSTKLEAANAKLEAANAKLEASNAKLAATTEQHRAANARLDAIKSHLASRSSRGAQPAAAWESAWTGSQRNLLRNMQMVNKKPLDENGKEKMFGSHLTPFTMTNDCRALTWAVTK